MKKITKKSILEELINLLITLATTGGAYVVCLLLTQGGYGDNYSSVIFMLGVVICARFTNGYIWGFIASGISTLLVNYAFAYPYFAVSFTEKGYPITFAIMLTVAILISMLTTQIKKHSKIEADIVNERMRGDLLRSVSHDVRTPLTSIVGASSAFVENHDKLDEQTQLKLISGVRDEAQWLIRVIENILTITRVDGEYAKIQKTPQAVEEIVGEAGLNFQKSHEDIKLNVALPEELLMINMDAMLIEQVMKNIMVNSVMHGGGVTEISISVRVEKDMAVFKLEDNGKGISNAAMEHLFDGLFINAQKGDSLKSMGIGLSLCNSIIKLHGGTMKGYNSDKGAVFEFTLPMGEFEDN